MTGLLRQLGVGSRPQISSKRFPLADSLRGLAIAGVVLGHAGGITTLHDWWLGRLVTNLSLSLDMFFLISGLLLYRQFVAARAAGRPEVSLRDFARRRFLRIVPVYWIVLTVLALWPGLPRVHTHDWWIYYGFMQTYNSHTVLDGLAVGWAICVEITFYLTLPLFAVALSRWSGRRFDVRKELVGLTLVAALPPFVRFLTTMGVFPVWLGYNTLLGYADFFAAGMALAVLSVHFRDREDAHWLPRTLGRRADLCWLAAGAIYLILAKFFYVAGPRGGRPVTWLDVHGNAFKIFLNGTGRYWLFLIMTVLITAPAVFGQQHGGVARRVLAFKPLIALGVISYSVSLWHDPLLNWVAATTGRHGGPYLFGNISATLIVGTVVLTLPIAWLSYHLLELPFLRMKTRRPRPPQPLAPEPEPAVAGSS